MAPASSGERVAAARVVDLLGQRLDGVEPGDEQRQAGEHDQRRGARPDAAEREPGDQRRAARAGRRRAAGQRSSAAQAAR